MALRDLKVQPGKQMKQLITEHWNVQKGMFMCNSTGLTSPADQMYHLCNSVMNRWLSQYISALSGMESAAQLSASQQLREIILSFKSQGPVLWELYPAMKFWMIMVCITEKSLVAMDTIQFVSESLFSTWAYTATVSVWVICSNVCEWNKNSISYCYKPSPPSHGSLFTETGVPFFLPVHNDVCSCHYTSYIYIVLVVSNTHHFAV